MEAEVVRYLLKEEKGKRAVLARLVLYCAPFLKRLKISATFRRTGNAYRRDGDFV